MEPKLTSDQSDWPFVYKLVSVDKLFEDRSYQRPKTENRIAKLSKEYMRELVGTLFVSERNDGSYAIIDGGTRYQATVRRNKLYDEPDITHLPCLVFAGRTLADEAQLFDHFNSSNLPVQGVDKFRAKVISGDTASVAVKELLTEAGYQIEDSSKDSFMKATPTLEKIYNRYGKEAVRFALKSSMNWRFNNDAKSSAFLYGLGKLYSTYPDRDRLPIEVAELAKLVQPSELLKDAKGKYQLSRKPGVAIGDFLSDVVRAYIKPKN